MDIQYNVQANEENRPVQVNYPRLTNQQKRTNSNQTGYNRVNPMTWYEWVV